jgi:hypothetical protein
MAQVLTSTDFGIPLFSEYQYDISKVPSNPMKYDIWYHEKTRDIKGKYKPG